ncbi:lysosomal acid glucosylceramidase-like [Ptiloglossa arizonensis]|uniref:lysosomal acid glucosylceramidase-like n=1 Tax=Ptiloglossa arizonensis TaxID=3350558 RepID=UPI003FA1859C
MWKVFLITVFFLVEGNAKDCVPYIVDNDIVGCICNATYCDDTPSNVPKIPPKGTSYWYVTNKEGLRMQLSSVKFDTYESSPGDVLTINKAKKYQTVLGFGGAFTDSVGLNIKKLSLATQDQLMRSYYCPNSGSGYNIGRIPIAGTDFSTRIYSYDDVASDASLRYFGLAPEDYEYKIPFAREALEMNPETIFFASAWSAPGWMKTNGVFEEFGYLKKEYYQTFADYLTLFVNEYKKNGLHIWAVTTGNEPTISFMVNRTNIITMGWTPESMSEWVGSFLGPTLASATKTVVLALDDDKGLLPDFVEPLFENENASKYTVGTGVHWYFHNKPITVLDQTHEEFPEKFLLMTEASIIDPIWGTANYSLKAWNHGEQYILSILEYMNHWTVGWIDWNLALDYQGGPSWMKNYLDAPIIVNPDKDEFYKQPMYYALKHFSRFVRRGSVRISITDTDAIKSTAFLTPSKEIVVVLYNSHSASKSVTLKDGGERGLHLTLSPYSMNTVIYKQ